MDGSQRREWRGCVFGHPDLTPAQKLVLLALETFADYPEGTNARPGVARLAEMSRLKTRVVEAALAKGRDLEMIEQTGRANPKRGIAASYRLISTRTNVRPEDDSIRTAVRVEGSLQPARNEFQPARNGVSTRTLMQPTNPLTPNQNTNEKTCATSPVSSLRFDEFWAAYPIRRDRRKAAKAFANALKRADADTIIAGAHRYTADPNRVDRFTKYAEGWLNGDCWLDDPLPNRNEGAPVHKLRVAAELAQELRGQGPVTAFERKKAANAEVFDSLADDPGSTSMLAIEPGQTNA